MCSLHCIDCTIEKFDKCVANAKGVILAIVYDGKQLGIDRVLTYKQDTANTIFTVVG